MKVRAKILCVDDDVINRATFVELLEDDFEIILAENGPEAIEKLHRYRPELVLLDIMMPGMNGYEVCERIRKTENLRHTKIIMISAKAMVAERLAGYDSGADDYMTKPFDHDELVAKIHVHLRLRASEEVEELQVSVMESLGSRTSAPMAGILGPLELLLSGDLLQPDEQLEFIGDAYRSAKSLQELFGYVLKLTSLKSKQLQFSFGHESVVDFLHVVTMEYAGAPIDIQADVPADLSADMDHDEMTFVLRTLIEGGLARNPDGRISIKAEALDEFVVISVLDSGPTLGPDELREAFAEGTVSYVSGLGLRRAAAQHVLWSHGGEIWVDSEEGSQTAFRVRLPAVPVPA